MEFLTGLFVGVFVNYYAFAFFILLGIIMSYSENEFSAIFCGGMLFAISYWMFDMRGINLLWVGIAYLCCGLLWSFVRYARFVKARLKQNRTATMLEPKYNIDKITSWVIVWPFSMVEFVAFDFIDLIRYTITTYFGGVYRKIYDSALEDAEKSKTVV